MRGNLYIKVEALKKIIRAKAKRKREKKRERGGGRRQGRADIACLNELCLIN